MTDLKTIQQVASELHCSEITIRRMIKAKKIPYRKIGSRYFFTSSDIEQYLASVKVEPIMTGVKNDTTR
jgi:excisionase family DNA binding protein